MIFYDLKTNGFYDSNFHEIPVGAINVSKAKRDEIISNQKIGKIVNLDPSGNIYFTSLIKKKSLDEQIELAKAEIRAKRSPMLDALTGIAGRATRAGNDALAAEADALAELLLDITDDQALNAATTYEEMQAAGVTAYKRIAASSSPELASVFREITGA